MARSPGLLSWPLLPLPQPCPLLLLPVSEHPLPLLLSQVYFQPQYHAEMCFLSWFCGNQLPANKRFQITWFVSWNPCPDCVAKVTEFLAEHPNVTLTISAARLYYYWGKDWRRALRRLHQAGARVKIMDYEGERRRGQGSVSGRNSMRDGWICNAMAGGVPGQPAGAGPALTTTDSQETKPGRAGPGSGESLTASLLFVSEFAYCWENFVYNEGQSFMPWDKFDDNYAFLHCKLKEILRNPMKAMYPHTFYFHFENLQKAYGRNETWLCFAVEIIKQHSTVSWKTGVFRNQVDPETHCHAERCFLSWFCDNTLSPKKNYQVTWYISWSPCPECAGEVAEFLATHSNVKLTIYTARLYYFWDTDYQEGLRSLSEEGASVEIMGYEDFKYCWENFVCDDGEPFKPWKGINTNFRFLERRLWKILQ
uniref:DNA dC->dU-editing enzyme APOBEC-3G n=1 Tax=Macaca mulatta TaxID=9544 RepID=A0A1D5R7Y3_MACMU